MESLVRRPATFLFRRECGRAVRPSGANDSKAAFFYKANRNLTADGTDNTDGRKVAAVFPIRIIRAIRGFLENRSRRSPYIIYHSPVARIVAVSRVAEFTVIYLLLI